MTVEEVLAQVEQVPEHVQHSLVNKSFNDNGCVYKLLCRSGDRAVRAELFIATYTEDAALPLLQRRVVEYIYLQDPR